VFPAPKCGIRLIFLFGFDVAQGADHDDKKPVLAMDQDGFC
jgi:hypothetical protein